MALTADITNFLTAQRVTTAPMVVAVLINIATVLLFWPLIGTLGFDGAPWALTLGQTLQSIVLWFLARSWLPDSGSWPVWNIRAAMTGWREMLMIAAPAGLMILCEW